MKVCVGLVTHGRKFTVKEELFDLFMMMMKKKKSKGELMMISCN